MSCLYYSSPYFPPDPLFIWLCMKLSASFGISTVDLWGRSYIGNLVNLAVVLVTSTSYISVSALLTRCNLLLQITFVGGHINALVHSTISTRAATARAATGASSAADLAGHILGLVHHARHVVWRL